MAKNYSADRFDSLHITIDVSTLSNPVKVRDNGNGWKYYAARFTYTGDAKNGGDITVPIRSTEALPTIEYVGTAKDVAWTNQQVATGLKNYSNMHTVVFNKIKDLYLNYVGETLT